MTKESGIWHDGVVNAACFGGDRHLGLKALTLGCWPISRRRSEYVPPSGWREQPDRGINWDQVIAVNTAILSAAVDRDVRLEHAGAPDIVFEDKVLRHHCRGAPLHDGRVERRREHNRPGL